MAINLLETGSEGLQAFYGNVSEAYIPKLEWPSAYDTYNVMRRRDPTLRAMLNAIRLLARQAEWKAEPASDGAGDRVAAEFLDGCLGDMSHTVADLLDDILTMLPFGWASLEICYKRRRGRRGQASLFDDGRIGWRKLAFRRQSSFDRWDFDQTGGWRGWWQRAAPDYRDVFLPIEKLLHFVAERDGNNPEGISLFESAYEPFHFVTNFQIIMGIGWQRSFVGLPVFEFEAGIKPQADDLATVKSVGQGLVVDEKQYVSVPPGVKFNLATAQNSGADALLNTIKYFRTVMLQIVLADFIALGATERGSWALGSDKSELFLMAVNGYLDRIAEAWSRFGVARLFEYNAFPGMTGQPRIAHSPIYKPNLTALGAFIQQIAQYIRIGDEDELWVRQQAGMPETLPGGGDDAGDVGNPELAELAAPDGRDAERAEIEALLADDLHEFLMEQAERMVREANAGRNPGDDDGFWEAERQRLYQRLLAAWMEHVNELARLIAEDVEETFRAGADWELVNEAAAEWARDFVGEEITGITETTRTQVRRAVTSWIETGQELPDLVKALAPTFGRQRAELIASTEVTRAFAEANDIVWQRMGLPKQAFKAPAHPRCRCYSRPEMLPNGEWVTVWSTVRDERVCRVPIKTPWGTVSGCRKLHGTITSRGEYMGRQFSEVRAGLQ